MPPGTHPRKPPKNNICLWAPLGPPRDPQGSSRTSWKSRNLPKSRKNQRKPNTLYKKHKEYYGINDAHTNTHGSRSGLPYHRHTQRHTHTHTHPHTHPHTHTYTHTHTHRKPSKTSSSTSDDKDHHNDCTNGQQEEYEKTFSVGPMSVTSLDVHQNSTKRR